MEAAVNVHLQGGPQAARFAREAVRDGLSGRVGDGVLDDMQLLVSEVVTNGIRHGTGDIALEVLLNTNLALVRCYDDGPGFAAGEPTPHADGSGGYGLLLVDRLSRRWGVEVHEGSCVWFELDT
jgi:anti-sigma regulatory factor (Ser/Thr protein kinase)